MISKNRQNFLLLHNIRSVYNVGSIFRTAEASGITKIYCSGTTPVPIDRFGRKRKDLAKVALGAEDMVDWEYVEHSLPLVKRLKKRGFEIISVEQASNSKPYNEIVRKTKNLILFGDEVNGLSPDLLAISDQILEIPMKGKKESLNVSVAVGIALFGLI